MKPERKAVLVKSLRSLGWRAGSIALIAGLNVISESLVSLELPQVAVVLLGLILSEATKFLSDHTDMLGAARKGKITI